MTLPCGRFGNQIAARPLAERLRAYLNRLFPARP